MIDGQREGSLVSIFSTRTPARLDLYRPALTPADQVRQLHPGLPIPEEVPPERYRKAEVGPIHAKPERRHHLFQRCEAGHKIHLWNVDGDDHSRPFQPKSGAQYFDEPVLWR